METLWKVLSFIVGLFFLELCNGLPINLENSGPDSHTQFLTGLVAVLLTVCSVVLLAGCLCCQRRNGFKEFRDSPAVASVANSSDHGHVNPIANSEFTIFTPISPPHLNNNVFLANQRIVNRTQEDYKYGDIDVTYWFDGTEEDFPRTRLKYIREFGKGWFGKVVEGTAQGLNENPEEWCSVVVRILEASATSRERVLFLYDATIYRCGSHPNVLKVLGRSLDTIPLLLLQEFCTEGDLKRYLRNNKSVYEKFLSSDLPLIWCYQLTSAVKFLHDHKVTHPDLAARNCQLTQDLQLKLGDYGLSATMYPEDYYEGAPGVPLRWCAPETISHTSTTIQSKQITFEGNIWSLGITLWEICECGEQPYSWLTDDEVVTQVVETPKVRLPRPSYNTIYTDYLYRLMQSCWSTSESRPSPSQIDLMLADLMQVYQHTKNIGHSEAYASIQDFDKRWETLKPNTVVKTDNETLDCAEDDLTALNTLNLHINNADELLGNKKLSASLNNLHGSLDNLLEFKNNFDPMESWLENVASDTGDMSYVKGLSEAIKDLDNAIALENVSSDSSHQQSPIPDVIPKQGKLHFKLGQVFKPKFAELPQNNGLQEGVSYVQRTTSSESETEDETWRKKIERGAYSEKVWQKSRSVADLMVLTHIDCSESDSETTLPSIDYKVNCKNVRYMKNMESASLKFGSEGNLLSVQGTFQEELRRLQDERRDSLLFVPDNFSQNNSSLGDISRKVNCDLPNVASTSSSRSSSCSSVQNSPVKKLIEELNSPSEILPAKQVYNVFNVSVEQKYSPLRLVSSLSEADVKTSRDKCNHNQSEIKTKLRDTCNNKSDIVDLGRDIYGTDNHFSIMVQEKCDQKTSMSQSDYSVETRSRDNKISIADKYNSTEKGGTEMNELHKNFSTRTIDVCNIENEILPTEKGVKSEICNKENGVCVTEDCKVIAERKSCLVENCKSDEENEVDCFLKSKIICGDADDDDVLEKTYHHLKQLNFLNHPDIIKTFLTEEVSSLSKEKSPVKCSVNNKDVSSMNKSENEKLVLNNEHFGKDKHALYSEKLLNKENESLNVESDNNLKKAVKNFPPTERIINALNDLDLKVKNKVPKLADIIQNNIELLDYIVENKKIKSNENLTEPLVQSQSTASKENCEGNGHLKNFTNSRSDESGTGNCRLLENCMSSDETRNNQEIIGVDAATKLQVLDENQMKLRDDEGVFIQTITSAMSIEDNEAVRCNSPSDLEKNGLVDSFEHDAVEGREDDSSGNKFNMTLLATSDEVCAEYKISNVEENEDLSRNANFDATKRVDVKEICLAFLQNEKEQTFQKIIQACRGSVNEDGSEDEDAEYLTRTVLGASNEESAKLLIEDESFLHFGDDDDLGNEVNFTTHHLRSRASIRNVENAMPQPQVKETVSKCVSKTVTSAAFTETEVKSVCTATNGEDSVEVETYEEIKSENGGERANCLFKRKETDFSNESPLCVDPKLLVSVPVGEERHLCFEEAKSSYLCVGKNEDLPPEKIIYANKEIFESVGEENRTGNQCGKLGVCCEDEPKALGIHEERKEKCNEENLADAATKLIVGSNQCEPSHTCVENVDESKESFELCSSKLPNHVADTCLRENTETSHDALQQGNALTNVSFSQVLNGETFELPYLYESKGENDRNGNASSQLRVEKNADLLVPEDDVGEKKELSDFMPSQEIKAFLIEEIKASNMDPKSHMLNDRDNFFIKNSVNETEEILDGGETTDKEIKSIEEKLRAQESNPLEQSAHLCVEDIDLEAETFEFLTRKDRSELSDETAKLNDPRETEQPIALNEEGEPSEKISQLAGTAASEESEHDALLPGEEEERKHDVEAFCRSDGGLRNTESDFNDLIDTEGNARDCAVDENKSEDQAEKLECDKDEINSASFVLFPNENEISGEDFITATRDFLVTEVMKYDDATPCENVEATADDGKESRANYESVGSIETVTATDDALTAVLDESSRFTDGPLLISKDVELERLNSAINSNKTKGLTTSSEEIIDKLTEIIKAEKQKEAKRSNFVGLVTFVAKPDDSLGWFKDEAETRASTITLASKETSNNAELHVTNHSFEGKETSNALTEEKHKHLDTILESTNLETGSDDGEVDETPAESMTINDLQRKEPADKKSQLEDEESSVLGVNLQCNEPNQNLDMSGVDKLNVQVTQDFLTNEVQSYENLGRPQVQFDLSDSQEEIAPNSLTHFSVFTSTPCLKRSLESTVILGASDDYSIDYYSGLKTSVDEAEDLQFSSNFMQQDGCKAPKPYGSGKDYNPFRRSSPNPSDHSDLKYSLETWDNFLGKTFDDQESSRNLDFSHFNEEPQSLLFLDGASFNGKEAKATDRTDDDECNYKITKVLEETYTPIGDVRSDETFNVHENCKEINGNSDQHGGTVQNLTFTKDSSLDANDITFKLKDEDSVASGSWEVGGGWFLHPRSNADDLSGQITPAQSSSSDSYVGFSMDDEIMTAIRNELLSKLPHAQRPSNEQVEDHEEVDPSEKNEVFVRYNVYSTPLSPIPEESYVDSDRSGNVTPQRCVSSEDDCGSDWSVQDNNSLNDETETQSPKLMENFVRGEPLNRHTPSQDSCCSNDTLFNLEELNTINDHDKMVDVAKCEDFCGCELKQKEKLSEHRQDCKFEAISIQSDSPCVASVDSAAPHVPQSHDVSATPPGTECCFKQEVAELESFPVNTMFDVPKISVHNYIIDFLNGERYDVLNGGVESVDKSEHDEGSTNSDVFLTVSDNTFSFGRNVAAPLNSPEDKPWKELQASFRRCEEGEEEMIEDKDILEALDESYMSGEDNVAVLDMTRREDGDGTFLAKLNKSDDANLRHISHVTDTSMPIGLDLSLINVSPVFVREGESLKSDCDTVGAKVCPSELSRTVAAGDCATVSMVDVTHSIGGYVTHTNREGVVVSDDNYDGDAVPSKKLLVSDRDATCDAAFEVGDAINDESIEATTIVTSGCGKVAGKITGERVDLSSDEELKHCLLRDGADGEGLSDKTGKISCENNEDDRYENVRISDTSGDAQYASLEDLKNQTNLTLQRHKDNMCCAEVIGDRLLTQADVDLTAAEEDKFERYEDMYGPLADIRFSGPANMQLMTTSFNENADLVDDQDWDSGSDTRSSSSGEFIWREGEHEASVKALHAAPQSENLDEIVPMEDIREENESSCTSGSECEEECPEFVPSAWDKYATPAKSALRSPEKSLERAAKEKKAKGVWFKKQKYHCVYEYPREPDSPLLQSFDLWKPTPDCTLEDIFGDPYLPTLDEPDCSQEYQTKSDKLPRNLYHLTSFPDLNMGPTMLDEDFFISSSSRPFDMLSGLTSQFFPGKQFADNWNENVTPDSGVEDITPAGLSDNGEFGKELQRSPLQVQTLKALATAAANRNSGRGIELGGLRHTRNKLKLDLPPSPSAFTSSRSFTVEPAEEIVSRQVPTFTTFGKSRFLVQHVDTPPDDKSVKNVSFEALPYKPAKQYYKDDFDKERHKVEMVRGEASLLDSADEDSGIESCTLERKKGVDV